MSEQSGNPRRYQRTTNGLIGSLIVSLLLVLLVGVVLRVDNGAAEQGPEAVDYTEAVDAAREAGFQVAHPSSLPQGWIATSVTFVPGPDPVWGLGLLTDDGTFAGVRQEDADLDDLLQTFVDEETTQGGDVTLTSPLGDTWQTYADDGGDRAYAAEVQVDGEPRTVLVYGSAGATQLRALLESLTLA